jgi:TRAP-type C4-dicarboxylate transport system permease small subunit
MHSVSNVRSRLLALLNLLSAYADTLCRVMLFLACFGMVAVIGAQVFFRYVLNYSLFWSEELGRVLLVQLTFFGAAVAYRAGAHIGVDTVVCRLSPAGRTMAARLTHVACLFLFVVMAVYGFKFADFLSVQMTTTLGVSKRIPFLAVPVSGCIMALHCLCFLFGPPSSTPCVSESARQGREDSRA